MSIDPQPACRVGVVGAGVIGTAVAEALTAGRICGAVLSGVVASRRDGPDAITALAARSDVLVEAAGITAVADCLDATERFGLTLIVCSTGAFADDTLADRLDRGGVILPPGAIGGLDVLAAVKRSGTLASVRLTTTKTPSALDVPPSPRGAETVFRGSAREAIRRFPRTANVAVTLALAADGLDRTAVEVIADPAVTRTRHVVTLDSDLGYHRFEFENTTAPGSGARTSAITIHSTLAAIDDAVARTLRRPVAPRR